MSKKLYELQLKCYEELLEKFDAEFILEKDQEKLKRLFEGREEVKKTISLVKSWLME